MPSEMCAFMGFAIKVASEADLAVAKAKGVKMMAVDEAGQVCAVWYELEGRIYLEWAGVPP